MRFPQPAARRLGLIGVMLLAGGPDSTASPEPTPASPAPGAAVPSAAALDCPQARQMEQAPDSYLVLTNPLPRSERYIAYGRILYEAQREPASCAACHGADGRGGPAGAALVPPPRNFACAETMNSLPDGQLYWVIARGSGEFHDPARQGAQQLPRPGRRSATSMQPYRDQLSETQIWELVTYIRTLAEPSAASGAER
jgi:mono/diheme cytochrome c family protein